jgi:hypothetical protein
MYKDLLETEKKLLPLLNETKNHHYLILNNHFKSNELDKFDDKYLGQTALPTPNHFYKNDINTFLTQKKKQVIIEP